MIYLHLGSFRLGLHWSFWLLLGLAAAAPRQPLPLIALGAAACHELGHLAAMAAVGAPPRSLNLSALGGRLQAGGFPTLWAELAALGAGAAVNLLLAVCCGWGAAYEARLFSAVNLVLGSFNLLPVQGFDGGRIFFLLAQHRWDGYRAAALSVGVSAAALVLLCCWCVLLWRQHPRLYGLLLLPIFPTAAFGGWLWGKE